MLRQPFTIGLTLATLLGAASAQEVRSMPEGSMQLRYGSAEGEHHLYDLASGELRRLEKAPEGAAPARGGVDCFSNDATPGTSSHPLTPQELVDWGTKSCGASGFVRSFTFAYRTDLPTNNVSVAFYEGTTGWGVLGNEVRRFTLTGMPGGFNVVKFITVDISSNPIFLPDGPIGWSFTNDDGWNAAGTLLAWAPDLLLGTYDALDVYDNPPATTGTYTGTFNFGAGTNRASVLMLIEEDDGSIQAGAALRFGSGVNPAALMPLTPPVIGSSWQATVDTSMHPGATGTAIVLCAAPTPAPISSAFGELLVDITQILTIDLGLGTHAVGVPNDLSLAGTVVYTQGLMLGGAGHQATNGIDLTIGF